MSASTSTHGEPVAQGLTRFGVSLLQTLAASSGGQNFAIAPLAAGACLAILHNAAGGDAREVIARGLGFDRRDPDTSVGVLARMVRGLPEPDPLTQLYVANGLWIRADMPARSQYMEANRALFEAEIAKAEFGPAISPAINGWVNRATHGKIARVIERGDQLGALTLVSAAYFKGFWARGFERRSTETMPFTLPGGDQKPCSMMSTWGRYSYLEEDGLQAVRMPYHGDQMSMYLVLPSSLPEFVENLTVERLVEWLTALYKSEHEALSIHLMLPRFRVEFDVVLNDALSALGMGLCFDRKRATFEGMCPDCPPGMHVSLIRHKVGLDVDEEGAEATAATWTGSVLDDSEANIPEMLVNRPFLFVIRDDVTGAPLFAGVVAEP